MSDGLFMSVTTPAGSTTTRLLSEWGLKSAMLKEGMNPELVLQLPTDLVENEVITGFSIVRLLQVRGTVTTQRFYGMALRPVRSSGGEKRTHKVQVFGPPFWMKRKTFLQAWSFADDASEGSSESPSDVSNVVINRGETQTLEEQLRDFFEFAVLKECPIQWDFTNLPVVKLPEMRERIASIWSLTEKLLEWVKHVTPVWDLTTIPPTLRFATPSTDANTVILGPWPRRRLTPDMVDFGNAEIIPRDDLLVNTVRVLYVRRQTVQFGTLRKGVVRTISIQQSAAEEGDDAFNAFGDLDIQIELRPVALNNGEELTPPESIPSGNLAATLHQPLLRLWHEIRCEVASQDVDWGWQVGQQIDPVGFGSDVDGARAIITSIERNLLQPRTRIEAGPPGRMAVMNFEALTRMERSRKEPTESSTQYGFEEDANEPDGSGTDPEDVCETKCDPSSGGVGGEGGGA